MEGTVGSFSKSNLIDFVFIEGIDCSGKTTLATNLKSKFCKKLFPLLFDRGVHSFYVFNSFHQNNNLSKIRDTYLSLVSHFPCYVVYLDINPDIAFQRMKSKLDFFKYSPDELKRLKYLFEESFKVLPFDNFLRLDAELHEDVLSDTVWNFLGGGNRFHD